MKKINFSFLAPHFSPRNEKLKKNENEKFSFSLQPIILANNNVKFHSILGQMVEFANSVYGEPVEFKVAEHSTLALSRGTKGFFAMGDLSQEFDTGLPDGSYCDIISECKQKVDVSGGRAYIGMF